VWFDALINYVSALGGPGAENFQTLWPHAQHLIGKDILKPHAVYWPCMLKAAGLPIFQRLNVHGYWRIGGGKMSKSIGNVVDALALADKYGNDAFRYFVMREMTFGLDADFSEEAFVGRLNADLANDLGNLASRASTLLVNFAGGVVPPAPAPGAAAGGLGAAFGKTLDDVRVAMDEFAFQRALASIWEFVGAVNRYVDASQPWALAKQPEQRARLEAVLYDLAQALHGLGLVLAPFLPEASARIRAALGESGEARLTAHPWGGLRAGARVEKIPGLFPRVDDKRAAASAAATPAAGDGGARISIDEFAKVDLRVAQVIAAEVVPKSKKLLKLRVSLGSEERTVLAGIAEHYTPGDLIGKKVVVVANLQPAKLMGIESQGMVLAGSTESGLGVITLDKDLPPGARVK
jgi:methionyl-tRNA synthetase